MFGWLVIDDKNGRKVKVMGRSQTDWRENWMKWIGEWEGSNNQHYRGRGKRGFGPNKSAGKGGRGSKMGKIGLRFDSD